MFTSVCESEASRKPVLLRERCASGNKPSKARHPPSQCDSMLSLFNVNVNVPVPAPTLTTAHSRDRSLPRPLTPATAHSRDRSLPRPLTLTTASRPPTRARPTETRVGFGCSDTCASDHRLAAQKSYFARKE
jgi:hypothetical protein